MRQPPALEGRLRKMQDDFDVEVHNLRDLITGETDGTRSVSVQAKLEGFACAEGAAYGATYALQLLRAQLDGVVGKLNREYLKCQATRKSPDFLAGFAEVLLHVDDAAGRH